MRRRPMYRGAQVLNAWLLGMLCGVSVLTAIRYAKEPPRVAPRAAAHYEHIMDTGCGLPGEE